MHKEAICGTNLAENAESHSFVYAGHITARGGVGRNLCFLKLGYFGEAFDLRLGYLSDPGFELVLQCRCLFL